MADRGMDIENIDEVSDRMQIKPCQPCDRKNVNNVAGVYCEDCGEYQCNECSNVHQHFTVMATHKFINISDSKLVSSRYDMKGLDLCKQHGNRLKFLCEDEDKLCCSTCAIVNHRTCHSVIEIEEKTKVGGGPALIILKKILMDINSKTKTYKQHTSKTRELLREGEKEIMDKIQETQDEVNKMFEELKRKVSHDISSFKEQAMIDLETQVSSCDIYVADVQQYLSVMENVTRLCTPSQQMIMFHYLRDQVRQLQQNTTKHMEQFKDVRMTFEFDNDLKMPPRNPVMPGTLTIEYLKAYDSLGNGKEKLLKVQKVNIKLLASIDLKQGTGNVSKPFYSGLDFLPDGRLVAVDNINKKCLVYNEQLQMVESFALSKHPQDVNTFSGDKIAVAADEKLIYFLEILDSHKISLKERKTVTFKYQSISAIDNEQFAVGTIDDPQPVRIVSVSGEEKELGINFPAKIYPVGHSACTYIQSYNKVVLTDRYAHTVYIYDIASNTRVEVKDEKIIMEPLDVAVGPGDCIFVCSRLKNTLVQISHSGQILSSHVLNMKHPYRISVSKDNKTLAVVNSASRKCKLQLYTI